MVTEEFCRCGHQKIFHGSSGLAESHGQCLINNCDCRKFTWSHEIEIDVKPSHGDMGYNE